MPRKKKETAKIEESSILEQLLQELTQEIDAKEGKLNRKITKGQALVKSMVNEALKGDQRMMANVLKFMEKLDTLQLTRKENEETREDLTEADETMILRYYGRHKESIEKELEKRYKEDPNGWGFYKQHVKNSETTT